MSPRIDAHDHLADLALAPGLPSTRPTTRSANLASLTSCANLRSSWTHVSAAPPTLREPNKWRPLKGNQHTRGADLRE